MTLSKLKKINVSWALLAFGGIGAFWLTKVQVDKNRKEAMKVRERMRLANTGDYEPSSRHF